MKTIKRKTITFILVICFAVLGMAVLLATQVNQQPVAHAHEISSIGFTEYDSSDALETIANIEDELQEQGTSILAVLQNQRNSYFSELSNASGNDQGVYYCNNRHPGRNNCRL